MRCPARLRQAIRPEKLARTPSRRTSQGRHGGECSGRPWALQCVQLKSAGCAGRYDRCSGRGLNQQRLRGASCFTRPARSPQRAGCLHCCAKRSRRRANHGGSVSSATLPFVTYAGYDAEVIRSAAAGAHS